MEPLGARLKRAREERGVSLRQIAEITKISVGSLEAIERNDFRRLPGGIFIRSFIRAYATEVGLDPETTIREFLAELSKREPARPRASARADITPDDLEFLERQKRAARFLRVGLVVACIAIIAIVVWFLRPVSWFGPAAPPAPPPASAPARSSSAGPPPPADPLPPPPPQVAPAEAGLRIEILVVSDCWVRATADSAVVFERLLRAGEKQQLSASREVRLEVGDAAAVRWSINGVRARPIGEAGVHREVVVTPQNLKDFLPRNLSGG